LSSWAAPASRWRKAAEVPVARPAQELLAQRPAAQDRAQQARRRVPRRQIRARQAISVEWEIPRR